MAIKVSLCQNSWEHVKRRQEAGEEVKSQRKVCQTWLDFNNCKDELFICIVPYAFQNPKGFHSFTQSILIKSVELIWIACTVYLVSWYPQVSPVICHWCTNRDKSTTKTSPEVNPVRETLRLQDPHHRRAKHWNKSSNLWVERTELTVLWQWIYECFFPVGFR